MIVALIGLAVSFFAYFVAFPRGRPKRFDVYLLVLAIHLLATITYWLFTFEAGTDAYTYWNDPFGYMAKPFLDPGTGFVVHFVQSVKSASGGSFLDHFFFFQAFGMVGIAFLMRALGEIAESLGIEVPMVTYLLLFIPGLHFWSVAIGKDAPMMMAIGIAAWASLRIDRRFLAMGAAILVMAMIRPHVGAITVIGGVVAVFVSGQVSHKAKMILAPLTIVGAIVTATVALRNFGLSFDVQVLQAFFEYQQDLGESHGSGAGIQDMPYPMKLFTLLFRPFFFDAPGLMGYAASVENLLLMFIIGYVVYNWKTVFYLSRRIGYMAYAVVTSSILIFLLSLVSYNIGLGQRQKMMAIPAILLIFGTVFMYKRFLRGQAMAFEPAAAEPPPQMSAAQA